MAAQQQAQELIFPNLGNYPLSELKRQYNNTIPLIYMNICNRLNVPYYYYFAFQFYIDYLSGVDGSIVTEMMQDAHNCLIYHYNIYSEECLYCDFVLFEYMIHTSHNIFQCRSALDIPEGPPAPPA